MPLTQSILNLIPNEELSRMKNFLEGTKQDLLRKKIHSCSSLSLNGIQDLQGIPSWNLWQILLNIPSKLWHFFQIVTFLPSCDIPEGNSDPSWKPTSIRREGSSLSAVMMVQDLHLDQSMRPAHFHPRVSSTLPSGSSTEEEPECYDDTTEAGRKREALPWSDPNMNDLIDLWSIHSLERKSLVVKNVLLKSSPGSSLIPSKPGTASPRLESFPLFRIEWTLVDWRSCQDCLWTCPLVSESWPSWSWHCFLLQDSCPVQGQTAKTWTTL